MPLGCAILASGRQKSWAAVQSICVVVSSLLDPLLIPWFQRRYGNGGLGVCAAVLISEILMVASGVAMLPRALDKAFFVALARGCAAGLAMTAVALLLRGAVHSLAAAPVAVLAYGAGLWAVGGLKKEQLGPLRDMLARKIKRS